MRRRLICQTASAVAGNDSTPGSTIRRRRFLYATLVPVAIRHAAGRLTRTRRGKQRRCSKARLRSRAPSSSGTACSRVTGAGLDRNLVVKPVPGCQTRRSPPQRPMAASVCRRGNTIVANEVRRRICDASGWYRATRPAFAVRSDRSARPLALTSKALRHLDGEIGGGSWARLLEQASSSRLPSAVQSFSALRICDHQLRWSMTVRSPDGPRRDRRAASFAGAVRWNASL